MSDTMAGLRRKIGSATDLQAVVRTMKTLAAASIGQYEQAVRSLRDYAQAVELGLGVCLRQGERSLLGSAPGATVAEPLVVVVFGSDQGLVGQFNDRVATATLAALADLPGPTQVWAVGERVYDRLADAGLAIAGLLPVPNSVQAITQLVTRLQLEYEAASRATAAAGWWVCYNRPDDGELYTPVTCRLLPLDQQWQQHLVEMPWPTRLWPEVTDGGPTTLQALIREYLHISLFRACAESLASENASRLAAMERADRNIDELLDELHARFHQLRQSSIDAELFDVISGFEALSGEAG